MSIIELKHVCQDCGESFDKDDPDMGTHTIRKLTERVAPGEPMPSGECKSCGALTHLEEVERAPETLTKGDTMFLLLCTAYDYNDEVHSTGNYGPTFDPPEKLFSTRTAAEKALAKARREWVRALYGLDYWYDLGDVWIGDEEPYAVEQKLKEMGVEVSLEERGDREPFKEASDEACDFFLSCVNLPNWIIQEVKVQ